MCIKSDPAEGVEKTPLISRKCFRANVDINDNLMGKVSDPCLQPGFSSLLKLEPLSSFML